MTKDEIISAINSHPNNAYRKCIDVNDEMFAYDTQIDTAKEIVGELASSVLRTNHVMLVAPMQGGKTGTVNSVVNIIENSQFKTFMHVKKYFFITGMNDCGLKQQTLERVLGQVASATPTNVYSSRRDKKNLDDKKFFVFKNCDLLGFEGNLDNSVIFIDEAHYGSNEKNILTQFLVKHGVDWKNTQELISRNIYIVSISATPFDELVSDTIQCKRMVTLQTDDNYVDVTKYLEADCIYDASKDDICEDGEIFEYIKEARERMEINMEAGIIFIRTTKYHIIEENPYIQANFEIYEMDSSNSKIQYDNLEDKIRQIIYANACNKRREAQAEINPIKDSARLKAQPLIVLIKGAFRAGITIKAAYKDIIYMIYDYSLKADTTAQALLGRMCGYRSEHSDIQKCSFYINKQFAHMYSSWECNFQNRDNIPSDKVSFEWVSDFYEGHDVEFGSKSCGNFYIDLSTDEIKNLYKQVKQAHKTNELMKKLFPKILQSHNISIDYDYFMESYMSGKNNYAKSSQEKRFNAFTTDLMVFPFRQDKIKEFIQDTNRDYLTKEDVGKKAVTIVLDAEIYDNGDRIEGNKRLLVYYVQVGQKRLALSRKKQYKPHKDTKLA